ncbi:MAG: tRNA uridine-5-carboxymethylaminomethyl(34) synthesis GTPase MnmE [Candidatus Didemnitutus sp.]|nr:tRNA uridine-5-carboxymethylaminomethyl(34) synthesis GTPase MnmE [Candidatus Didemnitutus sp.]
MVGSTDTIAALATPVGTAAIAVVRLSGPATREIGEGIFGQLAAPRAALHGDYHDHDGTVLDDVLVTFFAAPNSYTGEDTLEISCHGNPFIAQKILQDLLRRGCRSAEAGEFTKRAFLSGRIDLSQAEAVMDLIHARSERALAAANQQLRGSLGRRMDELIALLVNILAMVEAYIDFPEEDLPPEDRDAVMQQLRKLQAGTAALLATGHYGEMLRSGIRTIIVGEPNAGKSSLLNRLVGHDRALVSAEPGTTRDYLEETISIGAHALRLIDTAGFNTNPTALEERGMAKALEQAATADLFLWVIDAAAPLPALPKALAALVNSRNTLAVFNKSDLAAPSSVPADLPSLRLSALTGDGFDEFRSMLAKLADAFRTDVGDEVIAINARHAQALSRATQTLAAAQAKLAGNEPIELISSDLRETLHAFGEISGRIDNERILDALFLNFCIGK